MGWARADLRHARTVVILMGMKPRLLRADNFTPLERTPWGGTRICTHLKAALGLQGGRSIVGESWEVSVEPSFPSRMADSGVPLADVIAAAPEAWLGQAVTQRYHRQTPLLVKLLDAAENLSVQVHPSDDDPHLQADESGKPESWIILHAAPGAGLYLGFRQGVREEDVAACLQEGGRLDALMNFVPVQPGDTFQIEAGTPHAIGRGLTLIEPQHVTPGKRGITYRFWDWNRLYDPQGRRDPAGRPRPLHLERSLAVTRWEGPQGEALVSRCRAHRKTLAAGALRHERMVSWAWFHVDRLSGSGRWRWVLPDSMIALTAVSGAAAILYGGEETALRRGQSMVIPACIDEVTVIGQATQLFATYVPTGPG